MPTIPPSALWLLPVAVVAGLAAFGPVAHDLVRRPTRVSPWWAALPLLVLLANLVEAGWEMWHWADGREIVLRGTTGCIGAALSTAAVLCGQVGFLAVTRGLRPEGAPRIRSRRAWFLIGFAVLGGVGTPLALARFDAPALLSGTLPFWWAILAWSVALNRSGSERLEYARLAGAAWIALALGLAFVAVATAVAYQYGLPDSWIGASYPPGLLLRGIGASGGALGIWWFVSGPWPRWTRLGGVALVLVVLPGLSGLAFRPLPRGLEVGSWVDLDGAPPEWGGVPNRVRPCLGVGDGKGCGHKLGALFGDQKLADLPTAFFRQWAGQGVLVDGGHFVIPSAPPLPGIAAMEVQPLGSGRLRLRDSVFVTVEGGMAVELSGDDGFGPELSLEGASEVLRGSTSTAVIVHAHPEWTVQDFLSVCATVPQARRCSVW